MTPQPLAEEGKATFFATTGIDATGEEVLAENKYRRKGVWIVCDDGTNNALVSNAAAGPFATLVHANALPNGLQHIPGDGAVFVKAAAGTTQVSGWWY